MYLWGGGWIDKKLTGSARVGIDMNPQAAPPVETLRARRTYMLFPLLGPTTLFFALDISHLRISVGQPRPRVLGAHAGRWTARADVLQRCATGIALVEDVEREALHSYGWRRRGDEMGV